MCSACPPKTEDARAFLVKVYLLIMQHLGRNRPTWLSQGRSPHKDTIAGRNCANDYLRCTEGVCKRAVLGRLRSPTQVPVRSGEIEDVAEYRPSGTIYSHWSGRRCLYLSVRWSAVVPVLQGRSCLLAEQSAGTRMMAAAPKQTLDQYVESASLD